jgi:hypothetical protein
MGLFGNTLSADNQESPIGLLGGKGQKISDPIAMIPGVGDKWVDLTSHQIPKWTNQALAPVAQFNGKIDKAINPLRRIPAVDNVMNTVEAKPADAIGTAIGAYFAAPLLAGAAGGGAAGGGAAGAAGGAGGVAGGTGAITAAPGVTAGGSTALGSTAGMTGSWAPVAGSAQGINPMVQAMLRQQMSGNGLFGGQGRQQQQPVQLGAANGAPPQATISPAPTVNPVLRQQILNQLRGY